MERGASNCSRAMMKLLQRLDSRLGGYAGKALSSHDFVASHYRALPEFEGLDGWLHSHMRSGWLITFVTWRILVPLPVSLPWTTREVVRCCPLAQRASRLREVCSRHHVHAEAGAGASGKLSLKTKTLLYAWKS